MILNAIINALAFIPNLIFSLLPTINIAIPENLISGITGILSTLSFIFPIDRLMPILAISIAISGYQILWNIISSIKGMLPKILG